MFCAATAAALGAFQAARGLRVDGQCDEHTWNALVEASWSFGDRLLFLTSPNLRGDDVGELQSRLARLGFDCGRVDGIFGPRTARALDDFQSNCGLPADSVCGPETVRIITLLSGQSGTGPGIAAVREDEQLRHGGTLANTRVVVGQFGGLSAITRTLARELRVRGASVMSLDEPDAIAQALAANQYGGHVYIGVEGSPDPQALIHYYKVPAFESAAGRALAEAMECQLRLLPGVSPQLSGMRLPVLRETRMPAVLCVLGPVRQALDTAPQLAEHLVTALQTWLSPRR